MCFYTNLLGFIMALFNWQYFFKNYRIDDTFPTSELDVQNVLTFSFGDNQYTRFTNQKIATDTGQSSGTAEILFQDLKS